MIWFLVAITLGCTSPSDTSTNESENEADTTSEVSGVVNTLGTSERVCVDVDSIVSAGIPSALAGPDKQPVFDIRSGEIVAGNFDYVVDSWDDFNDGIAKIYWVPLDREVARTEALVVEVEPLDSDEPLGRFRFGGDGSWSVGAGGPFWPSGTAFPAPGRFRITATAIGHWGCFEVTV